MQFDGAKFKDLVHHICHSCEPSRLGAVKLHKVLYFSDMFFYAEHGHPISGETYRKQKFGPIAQHLWDVLSELQNEGKIEQRTVDYYGYTKKEFVSKVEPDKSRFSSEEIDTVQEFIEFVCGKTAKEVSDISHTQVWEAARIGEELPYHTVFQMFPVEITQDTIDWGRREAERIAREGMGARPL